MKSELLQLTTMDNGSHGKSCITVELYIPWRDKELAGRLWSALVIDKATADTLVKDFDLHRDMLIAAPRKNRQEAQALFADYAIAEPLSFLDTPPRTGEDGFGETPLETVLPIFDSLTRGEDVLLLRWTEAPSGFVPAILSTLSAPYVHIEKVIYPVRQHGCELSSEQVAYLYGLYDAFNNPLKPLSAFS